MTNSPAQAVALQARRHPIDLSARMAVCDANYIRLLKLLPDMHAAGRREFMLPQLGDGSQRVVLEVVESFKYTSTISIVLDVPGLASAYYRPPVMLVRLYHDASTAEVTSYQDERRIRVMYHEDELPRFYPDEKEQVNLFLAEWLALCLETGQGHPVLRPSPVAPCA
ncbi:MAG: DUF1249 domain-containing protein [Pseudomonadota bacterium]|nr:DUF1249 domain-containing protein [Pseudomonadota bacterium]